MDLPKPQPQEHVALDLSSMDNSPPPIKRGGNSLAVALVASVVLLVASAAIAGWMMLEKANGQVPQDTSPTKTVKKVAWVTPKMPAGYAKRDQSTRTTTVSYYFDAQATCGVTTVVGQAEAAEGKTAKDAVLNWLKKESPYITNTLSQDGPEFSLNNNDATEQFPFASLSVTQDVSAEGVAFKKQSATVLYKQFGKNIAHVVAFCKTDAWATKKAELEKLASTFTVKVEY
jgi:flagellar basal body-associated protein FliL